MNTEIPVPQDAPMDEFENTKTIDKKAVPKNSLKFLKLGVLGLVVLLLIGLGAYAVTSMNQSSGGSTATATPFAQNNSGVTPTPQSTVEFPREYQIVTDKITNFDNEVKTPSDSRTRLNPPSMTITAQFE